MTALRKFIGGIWVDTAALIAAGVIYLVPFAFILLMAAKTSPEAALFQFNLPKRWQLLQNLRDVIAYDDYRILLAFWNSIVLTVGSVLLIILFGALVAFVMQRRRDRVAGIAGALLLAGLIIPPAIVPTIFLLQQLHLYKTILGLMMVEVAFQLPFAVLVLTAFMASIPRELDEAAIIDGASPLQVFFYIILPLLRPAVITVVVVSAVAIYNDFTGPLYFLPGAKNITVQLTLYSFMSQFRSSWNLLFANVLLAAIPTFILFMFFQKQIVSGMTAGAIKG